MREITGYFDGNTVRLLEPSPKTKQKVIVTFIDDEKKIEELQTIRQTQKIVYIIEVIAEVVYVITKVYSVPRKASSEVVLSFMKARNMVCRNGAVAKRALLLYAENTLDFVDNILLAYHQVMGMTIYSYLK